MTPRARWRGFVCVRACVAGALLFAQFVAQGAVGWEVRHAAGGVHRRSDPFPLSVRLLGDDSDGRVRIRAGSLARDVELPARSVKELTFFLVGTTERSYRVELLGRRGELLESEAVTSVPVARAVPVVGIVGPHPAGFGLLRADDKHPLKAVHLRLSELPEDALAYGTFDALLLVNPLPGQLRAEQASAIGHWQEGGGSLFLAVGDTAPDLSPWTSIRAVEGTAARSLPEAGTLLGAPLGTTTEPFPLAWLAGGETFLRERLRSIGARERRGAGTVTVVGFDPTHRALASWAGLPELWRRQLAWVSPGLPEVGVPRQAGPGYRRFPDGIDFRAFAVESLARQTGVLPPSRWLLALLLGGYLLAIGPVDYFVLKRAGRLGATWITYPALVALFSTGAWAAASVNKSVDSVRWLAVRDLLPLSGVYREELTSMIFMGRGGTYRLTPRLAGGLPLPLTRDPDGYGRYGAPPRLTLTTFLQGEAAALADLPKWTPHFTRILRELPAGGARLDARLSVGGGKVSGELVPHLGTGADLDDSWLLLLVDGAMVSLQLGAQRDEAPMTVGPDPGRPVHAEVSPYSSSFTAGLLSASCWRLLGSSEDGARPGGRLTATAGGDGDLSAHLAAGGAVFVGHARERGAALLVEGGSPAPAGELLVRIPIPAEAVSR